MEIVKNTEYKVEFKAQMSESLANAIRRYVGEIPVLAIDEVEISKNDSPLYDETVAHRLGLVPLKMVASKQKEKLKLSVKKEGAVYSGDLKGNVEVVFDKIPLTVLNKGQEMELEASLTLGKGKEHSKFYPGLMVYRDVFEIKADKDCPVEIADICPKKVLEQKEGKVAVVDAAACDYCEICLEALKNKGKDCVKITPTDELLITIESFGQMDVKDIFAKSVEAFKKDLAEVKKKI